MRIERAAAVATALAIAGIAGGERAEGVAGPSIGWSRDDVSPVTQPAAIGDRFVLLVVQDGGLVALGLDAATGSTVWSDNASSSGIAPGQPPFFAVIGSNVIYLRRATGYIAQLVARDAGTGRDVWKGALGFYTSWPSLCPGATRTLCMSGQVATEPGAGRLLRFDARTGKRLSGPFIGGHGGRIVGDGLLDTGRRNPEVLVATNGARIVWRRPLRELFPHGRASTDWGWNFDRFPRAGLYVGSPGWAPVSESGGTSVVDLTGASTAAFGLRTGGLAWRDRGSFYFCNYLPCLGSRAESFDGPAQARSRGPSVGVRLRARGTVSSSASRPLPRASVEARATLEGFAPATGRRLWRYDAGRNRGLITQAELPPQVGAHSIVLARTDGSFEALNLGTGAHRAVAENAWAWCWRLRLYDLDVLGNGTPTSYAGQDALFPCDPRGRRRDFPPRVPRYVGAGARAAGLTAWSDTTAVRALPSR